jgi:hypothetical protein
MGVRALRCGARETSTATMLWSIRFPHERVHTQRASLALLRAQEYEITPEGTKITTLEQILLNGKNVCMMIPGGSPEDAESSDDDDEEDEDDDDGEEEGGASAPPLPASS